MILRRYISFVSLCFCFGLIACRSRPKDVSGGELRWAIGSAPRALDMYRDVSLNSNVVINLIYDRLVTLENLKLVPSLALSWKASTPTTYVYQLRTDAAFSDGQPVTAEDVAYSFNRNVAPGSTSHALSHLMTLKHASVTGPHEVTLELNQPDSTWIYDPLFVPVVERRVVEAAGPRYAAPNEPVIGSGPYIVQTYDGESGIVLVRNPHYWGRRPPVQQIDFSYIADPGSLALALRSGDIDGTFGIALSQAPEYKHLAGVALIRGPGLSTASLTLDMSEPPFDDPHVRRAFAYAWDGVGFEKNVLGGYASAANSNAPPGLWSNVATPEQIKNIYVSIPTIDFNLQQAAAELKQSHHPNGFTVPIAFPDVHPELGQALQVLAENLQTLGITLKISEIPYQQWVSLIGAHNHLTLQIAQWYGDYPDPSDYLVAQYAPSHAIKGQNNLSNYRSPAIDAIIRDELASQDTSHRVAVMTKAFQLAASDVPNINLYWPEALLALRAPHTYRNYNGMSAFEQWIYNLDTPPASEHNPPSPQK